MVQETRPAEICVIRSQKHAAGDQPSVLFPCLFRCEWTERCVSYVLHFDGQLLRGVGLMYVPSA
jgi:hypothetical protein